MAPTTIKKASGERTKTDRKDARMLAITLATDTYKSVHVPEEEDEFAKELTRTRTALKKHLKRAKQNLLSFLLRQNKSYPFPINYWTQKFTAWLDTDKRLQYSLETYRQEIKDLNNKIEQMDSFIEEIASSKRFKEKVDTSLYALLGWIRKQLYLLYVKFEILTVSLLQNSFLHSWVWFQDRNQAERR